MLIYRKYKNFTAERIMFYLFLDQTNLISKRKVKPMIFGFSRAQVDLIIIQNQVDQEEKRFLHIKIVSQN